MPQRFTIVFPEDVEHRYSEKMPSVGSVITARGKSWMVADQRKGRRVAVIELANATSVDWNGPVEASFSIETAAAH